ncbi:MAG: peptidylprolyl isomerase [Erythrobacter sp.]|nr:peptidylprolyl isomerase [Erythrobacter sp.]
MTEITAVPIKPVAKGSLTKLWLGVALAIAVGGGLAWAAVPRGVDLDTEVAGTGPTPKIGDVVFMNYKGTLAADGTVFDESRDIPLPVEGIFPKGTPFPIEEGATIPGFFEGLQQMQKGGKYTLFIPADKAYGAEPPQGAPIPPNADLEFEIEVIDIMSQATFERNLGILQQAMQKQGAPGVPGGAPAPQPTPEPAPAQ